MLNRIRIFYEFSLQIMTYTGCGKKFLPKVFFAVLQQSLGISQQNFTNLVIQYGHKGIIIVQLA